MNRTPPAGLPATIVRSAGAGLPAARKRLPPAAPTLGLLADPLAREPGAPPCT